MRKPSSKSCLWVVARAPQQGAKWFNGLERAVLFLDQHPKRCPVAPESFDPDRPVHVLRYGRKPHVYRVFFTVDDDAQRVNVVHVRRAVRRPPTPDELKGDWFRESAIVRSRRCRDRESLLWVPEILAPGFRKFWRLLRRRWPTELMPDLPWGRQAQDAWSAWMVRRA
jgi:toxin ParE1/3/4